MERFGEQRAGLLGGATSSLSPDAQELVNALDSSLTMKLNKASISMDERNDISLTLASNIDQGNLNVRISGTGDNCPVIEGRNLCRSEYSLQGNLFSTPRVLPVRLAGTNVGSSIINIKVCQNVRCAERQIIVPLMAGAMTSAAIITPTDRVLYGSQVPFAVMGYDTYGNPVEQTTTTYRLSTSAGSIIANGNIATSIELQQFDRTQSYFVDLTNAGSNATINLSLEPVNAPAGTVAPRATKTLSQTTGKLTTKYNTQTVSQINLTLPEDNSSYFRAQNGVAQLQE